MTEILPGPWAEFSDVWDTLYLGGKEWPGIAKVTVTRANKWDEKKAKGSNNADRTYTGTEPAKVKIELRFWNAADQYDVLVSECLPIVEPEDEKKRKDPLDISHAVTQARKVAKVTIDSVSGPDDNGDQTWTFTIEASEYKAPTVVAGPKGGGGKSKPSPGISCDELNSQHSYYLSDLANLEVDRRALAQDLANAEAMGVFGAAEVIVVQSKIMSIDNRIEAARANLQNIVATMQQKGCPVPPSSGGGVGP